MVKSILGRLRYLSNKGAKSSLSLHSGAQWTIRGVEPIMHTLGKLSCSNHQVPCKKHKPDESG
jgi:hypothetical protein